MIAFRSESVRLSVSWYLVTIVSGRDTPIVNSDATLDEVQNDEASYGCGCGPACAEWITHQGMAKHMGARTSVESRLPLAVPDG